MKTDCLIISVCREPSSNWETYGRSREEAQRNWEDAIASGGFERPLYRVVTSRRK